MRNKFLAGFIFGLSIFMLTGASYVYVHGDKTYTGLNRFMQGILADYVYRVDGSFAFYTDDVASASSVTAKMDKVIPSVAGRLAALNIAGQAYDSGAVIADYLTSAGIASLYYNETEITGMIANFITAAQVADSYYNETEITAKLADYLTSAQISSEFYTQSQIVAMLADFDSLPDQSGQNGKYLKTDGSVASWEAVTGTGDVSGPASTTENYVPLWDSTLKLLKDGLAALTTATANSLVKRDVNSSITVEAVYAQTYHGDGSNLTGVAGAGDVTGPAGGTSATNMARFADTTGKVLKTSKFYTDDDGDALFGVSETDDIELVFSGSANSGKITYAVADDVLVMNEPWHIGANYFEYSNMSKPATPADGKIRIYAQADKFYVLDDSGAETVLAAGGGGGGHTIQDDGTPMTARANLNFIGATVADNAGDNSTDITIAGGASITPTVITASATAEIGKFYINKLATQNYTMDLPASQADGSQVGFLADMGTGKLGGIGTTNLVAYYPFFSTATLPDDSFAAFELTNSNVTATTGVNGSGAAFNGSSSQFAITLDNPSDLFPKTAGWTLNVWVKKTATNAAYGIWSVGSNRQYFQLLANGTIDFQLYDGTNYAEPNYSLTTNDTNWHMYTLVWTGTQVKTYQDAGSLGADVALSALTQNVTDMKIGNYANYFNGSMDEFAIWKRALSATEITDLYNSGAGVFYEIPKITITPASGEQIVPYAADVPVVLSNMGDQASLYRYNGKWYTTPTMLK